MLKIRIQARDRLDELLQQVTELEQDSFPHLRMIELYAEFDELERIERPSEHRQSRAALLKTTSLRWFDLKIHYCGYVTGCFNQVKELVLAENPETYSREYDFNETFLVRVMEARDLLEKFRKPAKELSIAYERKKLEYKQWAEEKRLKRAAGGENSDSEWECTFITI